MDTTAPIPNENSNRGCPPTCPHCGYCPHCGRSNYPYFIPYYPPYWVTTPFITSTTDPIITTTTTYGNGNYYIMGGQYDGQAQ